MRISTSPRCAFCLLAAIFMILACAGSARAHPRKFIEGPCGSVFGTKVCTFYQARSGRVSEFGMTVPVAAIQQAPANAPMIWPPKQDLIVPFASVVRAQTGFIFANIYWEAHGHPPGAYMVPHFDFHFYFIPETDVKEIDCKDSTKPRTPPARYTLPDVTVPSLGKLTGLCVPAMGMHAIPDTDLALKTPWEASLLVGFYRGKPIFLEPMVTRARLLRKSTFSLAIPRVDRTPGVRYPREFRAVYHPKSRTYDFILSY
jgi:hypothetical protein